MSRRKKLYSEDLPQAPPAPSRPEIERKIYKLKRCRVLEHSGWDLVAICDGTIIKVYRSEQSELGYYFEIESPELGVIERHQIDLETAILVSRHVKVLSS